MPHDSVANFQLLITGASTGPENDTDIYKLSTDE